MGEPDSVTLTFGSMTADKFILYQSQLSPAGSKYTKLEGFPMRAAESN
jgi:2'-5' RNA ligase